MLIYDANKKIKNPNEALPMEAYLKGVYDAAEFKEEDHPRGGKGSEGGGRFVKSEKTKRKEDEVDDLGSPKERETESSQSESNGSKGDATESKVDSTKAQPTGEKKSGFFEWREKVKKDYERVNRTLSFYKQFPKMWDKYKDKIEKLRHEYDIGQPIVQEEVVHRMNNLRDKMNLEYNSNPKMREGSKETVSF